jgi:2'-5' RNA ligase
VSQQPCLIKLSEDREPPARLFFAILASVEAGARAADLAQRLRFANRLKGRPISRERLHVSLHGLGDYSRLSNVPVKSAMQAGASVHLPPFEISFDRVMSFASGNEKRAFVLRSDTAALKTLHQTLGIAMKRSGLGRWVNLQFTPHMTLLYDERIVEERPIETLRWIVQDFVLVHSLLGQNHYVHLARWPLRG